MPLDTDGAVDNNGQVTKRSVDMGMEAAFRLQVDFSEKGLVTGHDIRVIKCDGGDLGT